jgi:hypothetical protein
MTTFLCALTMGIASFCTDLLASLSQQPTKYGQDMTSSYYFQLYPSSELLT